MKLNTKQFFSFEDLDSDYSKTVNALNKPEEFMLLHIMNEINECNNTSFTYTNKENLKDLLMIVDTRPSLYPLFSIFLAVFEKTNLDLVNDLMEEFQIIEEFASDLVNIECSPEKEESDKGYHLSMATAFISDFSVISNDNKLSFETIVLQYIKEKYNKGYRNPTVYVKLKDKQLAIDNSIKTHFNNISRIFDGTIL